MFQGEELDRANAIAAHLAAVGASHGLSAAAVSVAWVLRRPEVTSAIVGARTPGQLAEIAAAGDAELGDALQSVPG